MAKLPTSTTPIASGAGQAQRLSGLAPVVAGNTVLLILGSFPGAASLAAQQYYAHPRNQFWPLLASILPASPYGTKKDSYQNRIAWLLQQGLGLWDVYASCERSGSLDSAIKCAQPNDCALIARQCARLAALAHNGGESFRHAGWGANLGVPAYKLPSTSPANASWSFARKQEAWRTVLQNCGLLA